MRALRFIGPWLCLALVTLVPLAIAATSPFLAWRQPIYISAGFAGVLGLALLLVQPVLMVGMLPGLSPRLERKAHRWVGVSLSIVVAVHIGGLWITSPPDVIDVLLLRSPTPFSIWGAIAMWALLATGGLAYLRGRRRIPVTLWRWGHLALSAILVIGTVLHAVLIEGTMGQTSKLVLCGFVCLACAYVILSRTGLIKTVK